MVQQIEITLNPKRRGFHLVTSEILSQLVSCIEVFLQKLKEHIYLENENLFPRAIQAEGLEEMV